MSFTEKRASTSRISGCIARRFFAIEPAQFRDCAASSRQLFQLLYIEGGAGHARFDSVVCPFQTPCAILVPPGFNHGFAFSRDIVGHIVTILSPHIPFTGGSAGGVMSEWLMQPQLISMAGAGEENLALLSSLLRQMQEEFHARKPYKNSLLDSLIKTAFIYILRYAFSSNPAMQDERQMYGHPRMERLQELIDRYYREHKPVSFYAKLLGFRRRISTGLSNSLRGERHKTWLQTG